MSVSLLNAALALNVKQSPADTVVLMVIAWRSHDGDGCAASVETLARWCNLTVRSVRRCLASLERKGLIRREPMRKAHGMGWRYAVTLTASATGDRMSPVGNACNAGDAGGTGDRMSADGGQNVRRQGTGCPPTGDGMSPNRQQIISSTPTSANAIARARGGVDDSTVIKPSRDMVIDAAARLEIPESFAAETADAWAATGWQTTAGIPITRRNVGTLLMKWWGNCDNRQYYETWEDWHNDNI